MKNVLKYLLLALIAVSQLFACGGSDDEKTPADNFDVQFTVPGSVDVTEGGECTFAVSGGGKSPLTTDTFILESDAGISYVCPIVNTSSDSFTVRLADGCETGYYKVFVKRDARKKSFGRIYINIVEDIDFKPDAATRKRAIRKEDVQRLMQAEIPADGSAYLDFARDIFLFSYL